MTNRANGMGSVFKTANGKWCASIKGADGKRKTKTKATENQARRALKDLLAERDQFTASGVVSSPALTVADVLDSWLALDLPNRNLAPGTMFSYEFRAAALKRELGTARVAVLRVRDLDAAFARMGGSRSTLHKAKQVLAMAFDFAIRREEMSRNMARLITLPTTAEPTKPGKAMTVEQAKALIAGTTDHRWHALFVVALNLGLRPGELTALCWDHVDLDGATLSVGRGVQRTKTGKSYLSDEVKTKRSRRTIAMPAHVVAALRVHQEQQRLDDMASGVRSDLVFRTSTGTIISLHNLLRELRIITERLGIEGEWTPNEMRHTAASLLVDQGVPLVTVADILGHTTTRMLEAVYRKNLRPAIDGGVAAMSALFG